ncbi:MltF family protein [Parabacteroides chinchillae]|uniref:Membrane-bound lytic murein transglycosylase F n=1 Tax=Parabacteroides chinchillae TaxID=871327 RepID=A0A8G2BUH6_9BACT|nr:transporter substrate-binding domain-containing protein [Parabacteroides chinchillae]SEF55262.1 membrane-bound lytic murein transglycosylase F [Parabacteroides chinchillae]
MYKKCIPFLLFLFLLGSCYSNKQGKEEDIDTHPVDLTQLKEKGEITAVTLYSSTSYFQYKMQPMGYEYDLINDFAKSEGLKLNIKVAENATRLIEMLEAGEADVVAYPIQITNKLKQEVLFCGREEQSSQVLVQRANKGDTILTDVTQLIGKDIYVKPNTKYSERLHNLDVELGGGINIKDIEKDTVTTEDLIEMVSKGQIPYTISDDNTARLNKTYYWNININLKVSFMQRSAWAVRKNSPELAKAINEWASDKSGSFTFKAVTKRYFELSKEPFRAELPEVKNGHISPYDQLFRKHAANIGWDWQLLASIAYQESRFNPSVVSWAGAEGLMGIMPNTAKALGVTPHELKNPEIGIRTGVDCLRRFRQGFSSIKDPQEKLKFTLASYNAGIGHVYDAQRLAEKYGKDPNKWDGNVAEYVRLKSDPQYYNDPVCKHGYLRGSETYNYVQEVMQRYKYYKEKTNS